MSQQDPQPTPRTPWLLIVLGVVLAVLVTLFLLKLYACPKPVPAAAPATAGQTTTPDAAEQQHKGEVAAG